MEVPADKDAWVVDRGARVSGGRMGKHAWRLEGCLEGGGTGTALRSRRAARGWGARGRRELAKHGCGMLGTEQKWALGGTEGCEGGGAHPVRRAPGARRSIREEGA